MNCDWCGKELGNRSVTIQIREQGVIHSHLAMHFDCFYKHFEEEKDGIKRTGTGDQEPTACDRPTEETTGEDTRTDGPS